MTGFEKKILEAIATGLKAAADVLDKAEVIGVASVEAETPPPAKRGRKPAQAVEVETEDDSDDEDETPAPKKGRGRPAKSKPVDDDLDDEDETEDDSDDEIDEDETEDVEDDEPTVNPKDLARIKKALDAYATKHGSKQKAVKVLLRFAPTAQQIKQRQVNDVLKALKV